MNLPNKLTMLRIFLVIPVIIFLVPFGDGAWARFVAGNTARIISGILFIIAALTDFLDGKIARKYELITDFGKLMDSLADKLLVIGVFIAFTQLGRVHALFVNIILARELLVTGIRQLAAAKGEVIAAAQFGKWKAFIQMLTLVYLLFEPVFHDTVLSSQSNPYLFGNILITISVVLTIASGLEYVIKYKHYFTSK